MFFLTLKTCIYQVWKRKISLSASGTITSLVNIDPRRKSTISKIDLSEFMKCFLSNVRSVVDALNITYFYLYYLIASMRFVW